MSKIEKSPSTLFPEVKSYIIQRKARNPDLSCRTLAREVSTKYVINVSKSSVSALLKAQGLSNPVGRRVKRVFNPSGEADGVGYAFLLGADILLGLSRMMGQLVKKCHPAARLSETALEVISEAWIFSKAIYNAPVERMEDYNRSELWFITGRKVSKGHLKAYIEMFQGLQTIKFQLVSELSHVLQDVHYVKVILADGTRFFLDGQFKSVWEKPPLIPLDYCALLHAVRSQIKAVFFECHPLIIYGVLPHMVLDEGVESFLLGWSDASLDKRIRKIELFSPGGAVLEHIDIVEARPMDFIIGVWPWQYKRIAELEGQSSWNRLYAEGLQKEVFYAEDLVKFTQHAKNTHIMLKLVVLKETRQGQAKIGLLVRSGEDGWETARLIQEYLRHCPDFDAGHDLFVETAQAPMPEGSFLSSEKIFEQVKKMTDTAGLDDVFAALVHILDLFAKKRFFPKACYDWSLLKMRELCYKERGLVERHMPKHVVFNLFGSKLLQENDVLEHAALKFNESPVVDSTARKLWILPPK